ncbi:MAG: hypothetical protein JWQ16_3385 [Novosphingobium sp.]|nr:hypothetical protein [Novosphingobium sp.]
MSPVSAAIAAELVVVLVIFMGAATYMNAGAILSAIQAWGLQ